MLQTTTRRNLREDELLKVYQNLLRNTENGKLRYGAIKKIAEEFKVCRKQISSVHYRTKASQNDDDVLEALEPTRKGKGGRKKISIEHIEE